MKYFFFSVFMALVSTGSVSAQPPAELAGVFFPNDENMRAVFNLYRAPLTKDGVKQFYAITSERNNKGRVKLGVVGNRKLSGKYKNRSLIMYTDGYAEIFSFEMEGTSLPLFGSTNQTDHLNHLKANPELLYEYQGGKLGGFLIPQLEATALLKYNNGRLIRMEITRKRYAQYKRVLENQHADRVIARACGTGLPTIDENKSIDLTRYAAHCIRDCDSEKARMLFGAILYEGPLVSGRPHGNGKWAILDTCRAKFSLANAASIREGAFSYGKPVGWHTVNYDSVKVEVNYSNGVPTQVKGYVMRLPFAGRGRVTAKLVNGQFQDANAYLYTGDDHPTPIAFNRGAPVPNGPMTYYNRNGEKVSLNMNADGNMQGKVIVEAPDKSMVFTRFFDAEGQLIPDRSQLTIRHWDIGQADLYPKSIIVEGEIIADLVNKKWGGQNLKISFPGTNLTLQGSFIPAHGFSPSTAPTGEHTLTGSWKGKTYNQTTEYKDGYLVEGEPLYKLPANPATVPVSLNYERVVASYALHSYEAKIKVPWDQGYGIGLERAAVSDKVCPLDLIFADGREKELYTKRVEISGKTKSVDYKSFTKYAGETIASVIIRPDANKCLGFMWVHLYK